MPDELGYLLDWRNEAGLGRGVGPNGRLPLTWQDLIAWARAMDARPAPHEMEAILRLDMAMMFPGKPSDDEDD